MEKDIFSMTKAEFTQKVKEQHLRLKQKNAQYGLPTTGYSETHRCIVDTYIDGRKEMVDMKKTKLIIPKNQNYSR